MFQSSNDNMNISGMVKGYAVAVTKTQRCTMHRQTDTPNIYRQVNEYARGCKDNCIDL